jgi:hypothetical protein
VGHETYKREKLMHTDIQESWRKKCLGNPRNRSKFNGSYIKDRKTWNGLSRLRLNINGGLLLKQ